MATKENEIFYFARTRSMASVLWNPKKNSATAEFDKMGLFATVDPKRAALVKGAGYIVVTPEEIAGRGLPLPVPDESPSANAQPGAPGGGYSQPGAPAPATDTVQNEDPIFVSQDADEGQKRTLR